MENMLKQILAEVQDLKKGQDTLNKEVQKMNESLTNTTTEFRSHFKYIKNAIENRAFALNDRLFEVETDIQRLNREQSLKKEIDDFCREHHASDEELLHALKKMKERNADRPKWSSDEEFAKSMARLNP